MTIMEERIGVSRLVRWCPVAETWQPAEESFCLWTECREGRVTHRLRLRRALVCSICDQAYFSNKAFDAHTCYSAF